MVWSDIMMCSLVALGGGLIGSNLTKILLTGKGLSLNYMKIVSMLTLVGGSVASVVITTILCWEDIRTIEALLGH